MNKSLLKEIKAIVWDENIVDPTEILMRFYETKGLKFSDFDKYIIRFYKPETVLRTSREISKPNSIKQGNLFDSNENRDRQ